MQNNINNLIVEAMRNERDGINELIKNTKGQYDEIVELILKIDKGRVIFMGIGKSGHIGKKLAATFSSTGTPSFFVHAAEAVHGDLGMITKDDIVFLISNSGNTHEVVQNIPYLKNIGCTTIAFVSNENSKLALGCDYQLIFPKVLEADHLNLAPTTSSTITLVLGDALAIAISKLKKFKKEDFHKFHPGGALGEKLSGAKDE